MFANVSKTWKNPEFDLPGASEIEIYLSEETTERFHGSCKDVTFPQTNGKLL